MCRSGVSPRCYQLGCLLLHGLLRQRLADCIVKCIHGLGANHDLSGDGVAGAFTDDEARGAGEAHGLRVFRILANSRQTGKRPALQWLHIAGKRKMNKFPHRPCYPSLSLEWLTPYNAISQLFI